MMTKQQACLFTLVVIIVFIGCKNKNETSPQTATIGVADDAIPPNLPNSEAGDIVRKAIYFSGGWKNWADKENVSYTKKIQFLDSLGNQLREASQLHLYQLRPTFKASITWEEEGNKHQIINNGNQAFKLENGKLQNDEANLNAAWNSSYGSQYVVCMPFKLADPGAILTYEGLDTLHNNKIVHAIKVDYKKFAGSAGGMHTWWYYFDKDSCEPVANFLDYGAGHSYTQYESFTQVDGIKINHVRKSYKTNANRDLLFVSTIYTNENIRFNEDFDEGLFEVKK